MSSVKYKVGDAVMAVVWKTIVSEEGESRIVSKTIKSIVLEDSLPGEVLIAWDEGTSFGISEKGWFVSKEYNGKNINNRQWGNILGKIDPALLPKCLTRKFDHVLKKV